MVSFSWFHAASRSELFFLCVMDCLIRSSSMSWCAKKEMNVLIIFKMILLSFLHTHLKKYLKCSSVGRVNANFFVSDWAKPEQFLSHLGKIIFSNPNMDIIEVTFLILSALQSTHTQTLTHTHTHTAKSHFSLLFFCPYHLSSFPFISGCAAT